MARSSNDSQLPDDVATAREPASRLKAASVRFLASSQCQLLADTVEKVGIADVVKS